MTLPPPTPSTSRRGLIGSNRIGVDVTVTAADIPERAGLEEDIDARFSWSATLDQNLIDQAAALIPQIAITNISGSMNFSGPSSESSFTGSGQNTTVRPAPGQKSSINLGKLRRADHHHGRRHHHLPGRQARLRLEAVGLRRR